MLISNGIFFKFSNEFYSLSKCHLIAQIVHVSSANLAVGAWTDISIANISIACGCFHSVSHQAVYRYCSTILHSRLKHTILKYSNLLLFHSAQWMCVLAVTPCIGNYHTGSTAYSVDWINSDF